ncbi:MAG: hypothetical protein ACKERG_04410 [Candidatus Hodgkinia cicadicola]
MLCWVPKLSCGLNWGSGEVSAAAVLEGGKRPEGAGVNVGWWVGMREVWRLLVRFRVVAELSSLRLELSNVLISSRCVVRN